MTLANLLVFALALMVAAGSPGPSIAALIARVLTNGFRDVLPFLAAMWLGEALWKMWFAPTQVSKGEMPSGQSPWRMFGAGLTITLGNPKIMLFYLALLPTIIDLDRVGTAAWIELTAVTLIVLMSVDFAWALLAVRARRLLTSRRAAKIANRASATMMAGAAAVIAAH